MMKIYIALMLVSLLGFMSMIVYERIENKKLRTENAMLVEKLIVQELAHEKVINSIISGKKRTFR